MDALSKILEAVNMKGVVYQNLTFTAQWGLEMAQDGNSQFWRLLKGKCLVKVPGSEMIAMNEGDLIFVPHGSTHWLASDPAIKKMPAAEYVKNRLSGNPVFVGDEEETIMIGGHFEFHKNPMHPFLKDLPNLIHIKNTEGENQQWLQQTANLIFAEVSHEKPGSKVIVGRLAEVVFIHTIRAYLEQATDKTGFLLALNDTKISKALKIMQESPEKEWTLNSLAASAGMSRTLFCNKFKKLVGETPLSYLTNWRIIKAKEILAISNENINEIAIQVGYQSEAAFNRMFKSKVNQTPATYRREQMAK